MRVDGLLKHVGGGGSWPATANVGSNGRFSVHCHVTQVPEGIGRGHSFEFRTPDGRRGNLVFRQQWRTLDLQRIVLYFEGKTELRQS